jgi:multiple sugar transport system permease protein
MQQTAMLPIGAARRRAGVDRRRIAPALRHLTLIAFSLVLLMPFLFMVSTSLKYQDDMIGFPPTLIPKAFNWTFYRAIFFGANFADKAAGYSSSAFEFFWFRNTAILVLLGMAGALATASLAAYAFARMRFRGRGFLFILVLSTMMIPAYVTLIPSYLIWKQVGVLNTYIPLVLPYFLGGGAFNIFLMRQFILTLPTEMDDAARIDGCGWFGVYSRIVLPLMKAPLVAIGIFTFLSIYNEFLGPLIYLTNPDLYPISIGLRLFATPSSFPPQIQAVMAASTVVMFPTVLVFLFTQRYFMQGVVISGVKG